MDNKCIREGSDEVIHYSLVLDDDPLPRGAVSPAGGIGVGDCRRPIAGDGGREPVWPEVCFEPVTTRTMGRV
ncbi:hypothetical protein Pmani_012531 [Petrolisthes manimaculis]|uniref:Uncharacterized protein n=1 Tax=Petrolisthes manimaculis TaxID=1843537 RepID=A0AAE1UEJ3_9EUCA|nr:hypothetical protein Pmani_012531 [Petrolisthes manimaculis]